MALVTDPIADMLTRIRNALIAKHNDVLIPASTVKKAIAEILLQEGYIKGYDLREDGVAEDIDIDPEVRPQQAEGHHRPPAHQQARPARLRP